MVSLEQARRYQAAGADALSVLTDSHYFGGSLDDLREVTTGLAETASALPCLRKDFMIHPLQVLQAREAGASAVLIIVRALDDDEIRALHDAARTAGLDALFEIHDEPDLERALRHEPRIVGVNNRDLAVFRTDLGISERLIPLLRAGSSRSAKAASSRAGTPPGQARRAPTRFWSAKR